MIKTELSTGIHTYSLFMNLTAAQFYTIKEKAHELGGTFETRADYWKNIYCYECHTFQQHGIMIYFSRQGPNIYTLKIRVEPCRVLDERDPTALFQAGKTAYKRLRKIADSMLKKLAVPHSIDEMSICRIDLTANLKFPDQKLVDLYLHILQKGYVSPAYKRDYFRKGSGKAKDPKQANIHSYELLCKSKSFLAYDKTAQLLMVERIPELPSERILRLEISLNKSQMVKHFGKKLGNQRYLKTGSIHTNDIIKKWLGKILYNKENNFSYDAAMEHILYMRCKKSQQEQLLYLLQRASKSGSLDMAIKKTCSQFHLSKAQMNRRIKKLGKQRVSPITIPNREYVKSLPSLLQLFE